MKWISIFSKKPKVGEYVVVLLHSGTPTIAKFDGVFFLEDELLVENITHWYPLPKSPLKEEMSIYNYDDVKIVGGLN